MSEQANDTLMGTLLTFCSRNSARLVERSLDLRPLHLLRNNLVRLAVSPINFSLKAQAVLYRLIVCNKIFRTV